MIFSSRLPLSQCLGADRFFYTPVGRRAWELLRQECNRARAVGTEFDNAARVIAEGLARVLLELKHKGLCLAFGNLPLIRIGGEAGGQRCRRTGQANPNITVERNFLELAVNSLGPCKVNLREVDVGRAAILDRKLDGVLIDLEGAMCQKAWRTWRSRVTGANGGVIRSKDTGDRFSIRGDGDKAGNVLNAIAARGGEDLIVSGFGGGIVNFRNGHSAESRSAECVFADDYSIAVHVVPGGE